MRDIKIRENLKFRFQADVFNALNRVQFGCISTSITSSNFGSAAQPFGRNQSRGSTEKN